MTDPAAPSREERLARQLRDNLRRRKAQARALESRGAVATPGESPDALPKAPGNG